MFNSKVFKITFLVLGVIIGAGFASGKEIVTFFSGSGNFTSFLVVLMSLLILYIVYIFLRVGKFIKPKNLADISKAVFGKFSKFFDVAIVLSLFVTVFAMLAGADEIASDVFTNYNFPIVSIVLSLLVIIIVTGGLSSLLKINSIIVPIMLVIVVVVCISFLFSANLQPVVVNTESSFLSIGTNLFSMLLYVCMNMLAVTVLVCQMGYAVNKTEGKKISVFSGLLIGVCVGLVLLVLFNSSLFIMFSPMPMIKVAYSVHNAFGSIYSLVILLSIFTTLISCSFAVSTWFNRYIKNIMLSISIVIFLAFLLSRLGFSYIVNLFYPIEGFLGLIFILGVIGFYYKNREEIRKLK